MLQPDNYPSQALREAVEAINSLPGVGKRSALRLALHLLKQPSDKIHRFASAIDKLAEGVHYCNTCMMVSDGERCSICADPKRDHNTICVVASDLTIKELTARVTPDTEVILALSGDVEGETTSFYIYRQIAPSGCKVTTLARGLGFGDDLEYADALTLGRSIANRQEFKP